MADTIPTPTPTSDGRHGTVRDFGQPLGHAPVQRQNVCPCCSGVGTVQELEIEQDGFRYIPDGGVFYNGQRLRISPSPARMLGALLANPGRVVTKEGLMAFSGTEAEAKVIDTWLCNVRRTIRECTGLDPIVTVWGRGLMWKLQTQA